MAASMYFTMPTSSALLLALLLPPPLLGIGSSGQVAATETSIGVVRKEDVITQFIVMTLALHRKNIGIDNVLPVLPLPP